MYDHPGHFADHPLEDLIEKIACQFTARHIRGRPRPPFWYLGWPLYVCDSRYNDRDRVFVKIKNWNSCVPEEVRKSTEFMPIYPFERTVFPRRFGSPFLTKNGKGPIKGPGGIEETDKREGDKAEVTGAGRKRPKRTAAAPVTGDLAGPNKGVYVGVPGAQGVSNVAPGSSSLQFQYQHHRSQASIGDRSVANAAGGLATLGNNALIEKLPPETGEFGCSLCFSF
jgi:chromatin structure-remodeling complex subunit RSC1/2